ncbi:MAG: AAA family ATPase [Candidatus Hydrothermarchaeaceae archaeon]
MTLYIGLAGRIGSGKTTISLHLQKEYGAREHRFSEILEDVLERLHLPHRREYLQKLGETLREEFGHDILVEALKRDLEEEKADTVVIDGVRYENEVEMLRRLEENILVFISAPPELRYQRTVKRGTRGEAVISFEQFSANDEAVTERELDIVEQRADYVLENTGTVDELLQKLDGVMKNRGR